MLENSLNYGIPLPNKTDEETDVADSLSAGLTIIDTELKNRKDELDSHKSVPDAHDSANIKHGDGNVRDALFEVNSRLTANETDIEEVDSRISSIVAQAGNDNTEIVDARGGFAVLHERLENFDSSLADIATNGKSLGLKLDGVTDDTVALQSILDQYDKVFIPDNIKISTVHIKRNNQQIDFKGKVFVTDRGLILGDASNGVNVKGVNLKVTEVIGTTSEVVGGVLTPVPTVKSGIVMEAVYFSRVTFDRIQGFEKGIYYPDGGNGTENKLLGGSIGECIKAIYFENTTPIAHEGNYILTSIFTSNTGIEISANCKYQSVQGVVDCAAITGGVDIHDKAGGNLFNLYFVRGQAEYLKLEKHSIVNIINGDESALFSIGSDSKRVIVGGNGIDVYSPSMENATPQKFYFPSESGGVGLYPRKTESNVNALSLISFNGKVGLDIRTDNGHIAFPSRLEGNLGGNFVNLNMNLEVPTPTVGETVYVIDTFSDSARQYVFVGGRWRYVNLT